MEAKSQPRHQVAWNAAASQPAPQPTHIPSSAPADSKPKRAGWEAPTEHETPIDWNTPSVQPQAPPAQTEAKQWVGDSWNAQKAAQPAVPAAAAAWAENKSAQDWQRSKGPAPGAAIGKASPQTPQESYFSPWNQVDKQQSAPQAQPAESKGPVAPVTLPVHFEQLSIVNDFSFGSLRNNVPADDRKPPAVQKAAERPQAAASQPAPAQPQTSFTNQWGHAQSAYPHQNGQPTQPSQPQQERPLPASSASLPAAQSSSHSPSPAPASVGGLPGRDSRERDREARHMPMHAMGHHQQIAQPMMSHFMPAYGQYPPMYVPAPYMGYQFPMPNQYAPPTYSGGRGHYSQSKSQGQGNYQMAPYPPAAPPGYPAPAAGNFGYDSQMGAVEDPVFTGNYYNAPQDTRGLPSAAPSAPASQKSPTTAPPAQEYGGQGSYSYPANQSYPGQPRFY